MYFLFSSRGLELAFALSLYLKCQKHEIPYTLELSKPVRIGELSKEILEAAKLWSERKLYRKYYKLKQLYLG